MKSDLATAAKVQKSLLPREFLRIEGVNFARAFKPCEELGGDILNVFPLDKKHVGFYVADISGHGVSAALLSVMLSRVMSSLPWQSSLLKQQVRGSSKYRLVPPVEVAEQLNLLFPMNSETRQLFTLLYGILNLETGEFRYVSAGHLGPIYLPHNSEPSILEEPGLPIGVLKEAGYEEHTVSMEPGDRLYLYSDGVTEATNSNDELFGKERLVNTVLQTRNIQLKNSIFYLLESVEEWCGDIAPADDISILGVELDCDEYKPRNG
jgi:sigma-B regulation protein RsbU (phosphoserine phosphatase)